MLNAAIAFATNNAFVMLGLALAGVLAYWYYDEVADADDRADAILGVGERTDDALGGLFGVLGALFVAGVSISVTIGSQLAELVGMVGEVLAGVPMIGGHIITAIFGALGLTGIVGITAGQFLLIAFVLIVITVAYRKRR
jgi:hypothetical protein